MKPHCDNKTTEQLQPGTVFSRLTVIKEHGMDKHRHRLFQFKCECGQEKIIVGSDVTRGKSQSCGCLELERLKTRNTLLTIQLRHARETPENAEHALFIAYAGQARRRKINFTLTRQEFSSLIRLNCDYCGKPPSNLFRAYGKKTFKFELAYSGIDRINPDVGYVLDNVLPCCKKCNFAKRRMARQEFIAWIKQVYSHLFSDHKP